MTKAIVLCGGVGTRLWPVSTTQTPKQFKALWGEESLFERALIALRDCDFIDEIIIVANVRYRALVEAFLKQHEIEAYKIICEPFQKNTAPAIALACEVIEATSSPSDVIVLPSDHLIQTYEPLLGALRSAKSRADAGDLITFGLSPAAPETGYGYIEFSANDAQPLKKVTKFHEKPTKALAAQYLKEGNYLWNTGIFYFKTSSYLEAVSQYLPQMREICAQSIRVDGHIVHVEEEIFSQVQSISIDYGVLEHSQNIQVCPLSLDWSDVGSWHSCWKAASKDEQGNLLEGRVAAHGVSNSFIKTESMSVGVCGLQDVVVVQSGNNLLVSSLAACQDVRSIAQTFAECGPQENEIVTRPWGCYQTLYEMPGLLMKKIIVNPHSRLSLQSHEHRSEHWVVHLGQASVQVDEKTVTLSKDEHVFIPCGAKHRLENCTSQPIEILELQLGAILSEDDIRRYEDDYNRAQDLT